MFTDHRSDCVAHRQSILARLYSDTGASTRLLLRHGGLARRGDLHGRCPRICPPVTRRRPSPPAPIGTSAPSSSSPWSAAPSTSSSSSVPDFAGDRIDHPLACDTSPHWPRDRPDPPFARASAGSREDRHRVRTPTTDRATGCRCVAPSGRSAAALVHPPASSAPSLVRTSPVASSSCTDSRTAATSSPRTVVLLHAVYLAVPAHRRLRLPPRRSHDAGRCRPRMVFVKLSALHRHVRVPPPRLLT